MTFEALCDHRYTFACVSCGHHPVTVVMDLHKKGVFSMPVSDIEEPPADFDGRVNAEDFWQKVQMEVISRGLVSSNKDNPFVIHPSYHNWAPWIGPHTRSGNVVFNTEYQKMHSPHSPVEELELTVTEDRLTDELLKVKMGDLRSLCGQCGVDPRGSRMDIVSRLQQEMKNRGSYDKVFSQIWGASGGWAVVTCPCAVVYAVKFNIRAESPRDYADILLSFKHFPNITLYDFARGLATHTNQRVPETFRPHGGRLCEPSDGNIAQAAQGELKVNLPWLKQKQKVPDPDGHPLTGSSAHYALYDRFHEDNTKDKRDVLRKMELSPEICGWVNSQTAEQLFSGMRRNNHFLNMMTPSSHVFLMRNILHHYNCFKNAAVMDNLKKSLGQEVTLNSYGQAVLGSQSTDLSTNQDRLTEAATLEAGVQHLPDDCTREVKTVDPVKAGMPCGPHCAVLMTVASIEAKRSCWSLALHHDQEKVLSYVLDTDKPPNEILVRCSNSCLTRSDFQTLGLQQQMDSTIGNACLRMIQKIAVSKGPYNLLKFLFKFAMC
ncbi:HMG domain-containing protein 3-like [Menidia menidia]